MAVNVCSSRFWSRSSAVRGLVSELIGKPLFSKKSARELAEFFRISPAVFLYGHPHANGSLLGL